MSYTKKEFVLEALAELGTPDSEFTIDPAEIMRGCIRLDAMVGEWNARGVRFPYPISNSPKDCNPEDATNIPRAAVQAVIASLAIQLANQYGKVVSRDTKSTAKRGFDSLARLAAIPGERQLPSTMPRGQGNRTARQTDPFFRVPTPNLPTGQGDTLNVPGVST